MKHLRLTLQHYHKWAVADTRRRREILGVKGARSGHLGCGVWVDHANCKRVEDTAGRASGANDTNGTANSTADYICPAS